MKKLFQTLLLLILANSLLAQTNYPPATSFYINNLSNWVYDCNFYGYAGTLPGFSPLPCGWYDEVIDTNPPPPVYPSVQWVPGPYDLWLSVDDSYIYDSIDKTHTPPIHTPMVGLTLQIHNGVPGSTYDFYGISDLTSTNWQYLASTVYDPSDPEYDVVFTNMLCGFFRVHGAKLQPPVSPLEPIMPELDCMAGMWLGFQFWMVWRK
jgi:hypothetical protein